MSSTDVHEAYGVGDGIDIEVRNTNTIPQRHTSVEKSIA